MDSNSSLFYRNGLTDRFRGTDEVVIYGAGVMGRALRTCLEDAPYRMHVKSFLVESTEDNPEDIDGIPVIDAGHADKYRGALVLVALHEKHMDGAVAGLREKGFRDIVPVSFDSDAWSDIRGNWFRHRRDPAGAVCTDLGEELKKKDGVHIYVACSVADRRMKEDAAAGSWEVPVQAGAALTERVIAPVRDDQGSNISGRNRKYCELTVLYWIWKNDRSKYAGLSHYRRRFVLDGDMVRRLAGSDIDAVLTVPVLNFPDVRRRYCADHDPGDWDVMLEALRLMRPEYMETAEAVQNGIYYYAYNMFIARKEVLDRYCEWLFPVLFYCEERIGDKEDGYQNRYIGFLAERLMTVFFEHHRKEYRLAVARKHFIGTEG